MSEVRNLGPIEQLRAGRLGRRLPQLLFGLWLYGFAMALIIRGVLGVDPWDVFHQGLQPRLPLSFGGVTILVGAVVLLLWIPLRQKPGLGTVLNVFVVGIAADMGLWLVPPVEHLGIRVTLLISGIVLNGLAGALYIGAQFGPGPRDGLMTGFSRVTGLSLRVIRTAIEVTVLAVGWVLGGNVGIGTVLYALGIGPLVQFFLPRVAVRLKPADDE